MPLEDVIDARIDRRLADVLSLPPELVAWIPRLVAGSSERFPRSAVDGLYTVGDSIAELGEPVHGRPCMIRAGSSPYGFMQMTFDEVANLWVSTQSWLSFQTQGSYTTTNTSYIQMPASYWPSQMIPNVLDFKDAGLRIQVIILTSLVAGASGTVYIQPRVWSVDLDAGSTVAITTGGPGELTHNTTSVVWKSGGWVDLVWSGASPYDNVGVLTIDTKYATAAGVVDKTSVMMRWVADPV